MYLEMYQSLCILGDAQNLPRDILQCNFSEMHKDKVYHYYFSCYSSFDDDDTVDYYTLWLNS